MNFSMFSGSSAAHPVGPDGDADVAGGEHLGGQLGQPAAELAAERQRRPSGRASPSSARPARGPPPGSPSTHAVATRWATGSHSRFHVGRLASTHSVADQPLASVAPAGKSVAGSSHSSASFTASLTAARWLPVNDDVVAASCWCAICAARS